jgi:hypothetical protein
VPRRLRAPPTTARATTAGLRPLARTCARSPQPGPPAPPSPARSASTAAPLGEVGRLPPCSPVDGLESHTHRPDAARVACSLVVTTRASLGSIAELALASAAKHRRRRSGASSPISRTVRSPHSCTWHRGERRARLCARQYGTTSAGIRRDAPDALCSRLRPWTAGGTIAGPPRRPRRRGRPWSRPYRRSGEQCRGEPAARQRGSRMPRAFRRTRRALMLTVARIVPGVCWALGVSAHRHQVHGRPSEPHTFSSQSPDGRGGASVVTQTIDPAAAGPRDGRALRGEALIDVGSESPTEIGASRRRDAPSASEQAPEHRRGCS